MTTDLKPPLTGIAIADWRDVLTVETVEIRNARCRAFLEELRWPQGIRCPRCASGQVTRVASRRQIDCRACRYRFSVTSGTYLHDSAVPLWKWLVAVSLLVESEDGFPAHRLTGTIGVSYKTAWSLGHRVRAAMTATEPAGASADPVSGSYHLVSEKYRDAYRGEQQWRAANRTNPEAFADALRALLRSAPPRE
ncbi:MAG TPA: IS1595 family transposase [Gaiellaceae bacterium]|jgi:transposase-like protein